jgi:uncharacterized protein
LIATGYIEYMIPFNKNSNNGKYILDDYFSLFHLTFMNNRKTTNWISHAESTAYKTWCGLTFERICYLHKKEILNALGISGIQTQTSYLAIKDEKGKMTAQIDMLIDRSDNVYNLCEIKFSNDVYQLSKVESESIRKKVFYFKEQIKKRKSVFPVMITTFGCEKNMHYLGIITNQVVLDDLFRAD